MANLTHQDPLDALLPELSTGRPLPPLSRAAVALARTVLTWQGRHRTRRRLSQLDAHLLCDIGLSAQEIHAECEKPFWHG